MAAKNSEDTTFNCRDDNFLEGMNTLLKEKVLTDVAFVFNEGSVRVPAHELFLMASSSVFRTMFNGSLPEGSEVVMNDPEIDVENFRTFIQCLSTGKVKINLGNVAQQIYLAHKYEAKSLENACSRFLKRNLKSSNVFDILHIADCYNMDDLKQESIRLLSSEFTGKAKDVKLFSKLPRGHIIAVIDELLEDEDIADEEYVQVYHILKAIKAWLKDESQKLLSQKKTASEMAAALQSTGKGCKRKIDKK